ncbi:MAG: hypothetical protein IPG44_10080 [Anaerolineales bacterium]|nr:hypothetical protein [Anaerolineales bacterium]
MSKIVRTSLFLMVALSLVLAACGAPAEEAPATEVATEVAATEVATEAPTEDPMAAYAPDAVEGDVVTAGSSTNLPALERMAEEFRTKALLATSLLTARHVFAGFRTTSAPLEESDISNASRKIKDSGVDLCRHCSYPR